MVWEVGFDEYADMKTLAPNKYTRRAAIKPLKTDE